MSFNVIKMIKFLLPGSNRSRKLQNSCTGASLLNVVYHLTKDPKLIHNSDNKVC